LDEFADNQPKLDMKFLASLRCRPGDEAVRGYWPCAVLGLVIAVWVLLTPLAAATPPDTTWIAGFYDDDDFDDVVIDIGRLAGVCDWSAPPDFALKFDVQPVVLPGVPPVVCGTRFTLQDRSPPIF